MLLFAAMKRVWAVQQRKAVRDGRCVGCWKTGQYFVGVHLHSFLASKRNLKKYYFLWEMLQVGQEQALPNIVGEASERIFRIG